MIEFDGTTEQALAKYPEAVHMVAGAGTVEVYFAGDVLPPYAQPDPTHQVDTTPIE